MSSYSAEFFDLADQPAMVDPDWAARATFHPFWAPPHMFDGSFDFQQQSFPPPCLIAGSMIDNEPINIFDESGLTYAAGPQALEETISLDALSGQIPNSEPNQVPASQPDESDHSPEPPREGPTGLRGPVTCGECQKVSYSWTELYEHCTFSGHHTLIGADCKHCTQQWESWNVIGLDLNDYTSRHELLPTTCDYCERKLFSWHDFKMHAGVPKKATKFATKCGNCEQSFDTTCELADHVIATRHRQIICNNEGCGSSCSGMAEYRRHLMIHVEDGAWFPCNFCKWHKGPTVFRRKDHLTQHLRNYHHHQIDSYPTYKNYPCHHDDCIPQEAAACEYEERRVFQKQSDLTTHLKNVHDESPFPCTVSGCNRIGGKGYSRKCDLQKHIEKCHTEKDE